MLYTCWISVAVEAPKNPETLPAHLVPKAAGLMNSKDVYIYGSPLPPLLGMKKLVFACCWLHLDSDQGGQAEPASLLQAGMYLMEDPKGLLEALSNPAPSPGFRDTCEFPDSWSEVGGLGCRASPWRGEGPTGADRRLRGYGPPGQPGKADHCRSFHVVQKKNM